MKTKDEALKMAVEQLWSCSMLMNLDHSDYLYEDVIKAHDACKQALAEAEKQEPVAIVMEDSYGYGASLYKRLPLGTKLYTHPTPSWQSLSDDEIEYWECLKAPPVHPDFVDDDSWHGFARAIEQALKEKNT